LLPVLHQNRNVTRRSFLLPLVPVAVSLTSMLSPAAAAPD
jgi:hypothetical protein